MRKSVFPLVLGCVAVLALAFSSCRDDRQLAAPPSVANQSFSEEFDTVSASLSRGWQLSNGSVPVGSGVWQQGGSVNPWFPAFSSSGSYVGFIGADYTSTSAQQGLISNWLISPVITMQNGDKITFYTRALQYPDGAGDTTDYGNRLQVRISTTGQDFVAGKGDDIGTFKTSLLDINPNYIFSSVLPGADPKAYPTQWTRFEATVYGLNGPVKGRFAFRYFVEDGGSNGLGSGVGIDKVQYQSVSR
jgi:hypothetical protein